MIAVMEQNCHKIFEFQIHLIRITVNVRSPTGSESSFSKSVAHAPTRPISTPISLPDDSDVALLWLDDFVRLLTFCSTFRVSFVSSLV